MSIYLRIILVVISIQTADRKLYFLDHFFTAADTGGSLPGSDVLACRAFGHPVSGKYGISLCYLYPFN